MLILLETSRGRYEGDATGNRLIPYNHNRPSSQSTIIAKCIFDPYDNFWANMNGLTLMLVLANLVITKWCKKSQQELSNGY